MIRVALFISLVALFYYYCKEDNSASYNRAPNHINMIDVPEEISPSSLYEYIPEASLKSDSSVYFILAPPTYFERSSKLSSSIPTYH